MAISNISGYANNYDNLYTSNQMRTNGTDKSSETTSAGQTSEAYLNNLRQKYSNVNITVADFSSEKQLKSYMFGCGGYNNIAISSSIIEKMASDPATAAKYEKVIADAPNLGEEFKSECAALGTELLSCGTVIDKDGNVSYWGIGRMKEDVENPGTLYKEKVQKQLEEKRTEKKKQEKAESNRTEKEKAQELRMVSAKTKKELISKIRKNETQEISAGMVEKMISEDALRKAETHPDLIILDINLPSMNGIEVCKKIRDFVDCPILFLTARIEEQDKITGLRAGGDDYIVKPFSLGELLARIEAHLRRENRKQAKKDFRYDNDLCIDYSSRQIFWKQNEIELTKSEFDIVELLSTYPGQVFDREMIYERLWGFDRDGDNKIVTELIRRIRNKLKNYTEKDYIETVWGCGYKWASRK